jgi:spermidine synthase
VIPWETVDRARAPDGAELVLARRGDEWAVRAGGHVLMTSRAHGSEEALAAEVLARIAAPRDVLVGGLGLGFTLRAALDRLPAAARVVVAELVPALVAWNRGPVAHLACRPLDDPRVRVAEGDVLERIAASVAAWDAILLDVDNGPAALAHPRTTASTARRGPACHAALRRGGALAVWSAGQDPRYLARLERAGFAAQAIVAPARGGAGGGRHAVIVAVRGGDQRTRPAGPRPGGAARSRS